MFRSILSKSILTFPLLAIAALLHATASPSDTILLTSSNKILNSALSEIIAKRPPIDDFGVVLANIHDFPAELVKAAKSELMFNERLQIVSVVKGSLADQLGLKPGDQLLQINSFYISRGEAALKEFADRVSDGVDWKGAINTTIIRDGYGQNYSTPTPEAKG